MWGIRWRRTSLREFSNAPTRSSPKTPLSFKAISKTESPRESPPGSWRIGQVRRNSVSDFLSDKELSNVFRRVDSQFRNFAAAVAEADIAAAKNQLTADIQNRVADAQKKLAKALAKQIEQSLPTSKSGDQWWVDPIIGLRGQVNFTRWLFLALQGDVGGFGAGSQIAWFASGSIGVNLTRNVFLETGYRYFYMDYVKNGLVYDAAQSGLFMGVGLKF